MNLVEGFPVEMQGSGKNPYILKNVSGTLSCSCPAWANQSAAINARTCKHLKKLLGEENELLRIGSDPGKVQEMLKHASGRKLRQDEKAKLNGPKILLAQPWDPDVDPTGYWVSEKLDGVRALWDGTVFVSRQGNVYQAPTWFTATLPSHALDGELWVARGAFQKTISIVKRSDAGEQWRDVRYVVYDAPHHGGVFEERLAFLQTLTLGEYAYVLEQKICPDKAHLERALKIETLLGAEGLMLRQPGSLYETKRSSTLLKVKPWEDAEAVVTGHSAGRGRHKGRMGAMNVRMGDLEFEIGTGFSDAERENPPAIGATISFSFTGKTDRGVPKCTGYLRVRDE